jgi:hypothetical protein
MCAWIPDIYCMQRSISLPPEELWHILANFFNVDPVNLFARIVAVTYMP